MELLSGANRQSQNVRDMSLLDLPQDVVNTLSIQPASKRVHQFPLLAEDDENYFDPTRLIVRKDGVSYVLGKPRTLEERRKFERERKQKWMNKPGVREEQRAKNRARQARLRQKRLASQSTASQASSTTLSTEREPKT
jgi:hypothetical protein